LSKSGYELHFSDVFCKLKVRYAKLFKSIGVIVGSI